MTNPRLFLAVDNCFAAKRWTSPDDWLRVVKELGVDLVEASTDVECDALLMGSQYLAGWTSCVKDLTSELGMRIANFFTGYSTYRTIGLAHQDPSVRDRLAQKWMKPTLDAAAALGAGFGCFMHAMPQSALDDAAEYEATWARVLETIGRIVEYGTESGARHVSVEQMYTPHQPPWTIRGAEIYLADLWRTTGKPSYITIDTGHQTGQARFLMPQAEHITAALDSARREMPTERLWLGPESARRAFRRGLSMSPSRDDRTARIVLDELGRYPHLFAHPEDSSLYEWLRRLGCYSPIIHLQQTDGVQSSHSPFTEDLNSTGIVDAREVVLAIGQAYRRRPASHLPPMCKEIFFTLEVTASTYDTTDIIVERMKASVEYWRRAIPYDGIPLEDAVRIAAGGSSELEK